MKTDFTMKEVVERLWRYERHMISDGYDLALKELSSMVDLDTIDIPSGDRCNTWVVPQKWTCHDAYIEDMEGRKILRIGDGRLFCAAYSQPFDGVLSMDELRSHIISDHPVPTNDMTDGVPFVWKFYYRKGWGLLCSKETLSNLTDERYRIVVDTEFSPGFLRIAELTLPGDREDVFLICAHLCHPFMVQDGLSGVAVGLDVMKRLSRMPKRRYTYKMIIAPETIGGICWIDRNLELIPKVRGGVYLDMLGLPYPHALQHSFLADSEVDRCFSFAMKETDTDGWEDGFRQVVGNDERQYSGPGVRIPMVGLSRSLPRSHRYFPYREYHTNLDTPETIASGSLETSSQLLLKAIDMLEYNAYPVNNYLGEIFLAGAGIDVDWYRNQIEHAHIMDTMHLIDGQHSILDIIEQTGFSFGVVAEVIEMFRDKGLVILENCPVKNTLWMASPRDCAHPLTRPAEVKKGMR